MAEKGESSETYDKDYWYFPFLHKITVYLSNYNNAPEIKEINTTRKSMQASNMTKCLRRKYVPQLEL